MAMASPINAQQAPIWGRPKVFFKCLCGRDIVKNFCEDNRLSTLLRLNHEMRTLVRSRFVLQQPALALERNVPRHAALEALLDDRCNFWQELLCKVIARPKYDPP